MWHLIRRMWKTRQPAHDEIANNISSKQKFRDRNDFSPILISRPLNSLRVRHVCLVLFSFGFSVISCPLWLVLQPRLFAPASHWLHPCVVFKPQFWPLQLHVGLVSVPVSQFGPSLILGVVVWTVFAHRLHTCNLLADFCTRALLPDLLRTGLFAF